MERLLQPGGVAGFEGRNARRRGLDVFAPYLTDTDEQDTLRAEPFAGSWHRHGRCLDRSDPAELGRGISYGARGDALLQVTWGVSPNSMEVSGRFGCEAR